MQTQFTMKKIVTLFAFVFLSIGIAQAQETKLPAKLTRTMLEKLDLNDKQEAKVIKITSNLQSKVDQIIQSSDLTRKQKNGVILKYAERERMNMQNLLTEAQYEKYMKLTGRN